MNFELEDCLSRRDGRVPVVQLAPFTPHLVCPVSQSFTPVLRAIQDPHVLRLSGAGHFEPFESLLDFPMGVLSSHYGLACGMPSACFIGREEVETGIQDPELLVFLYSPLHSENLPHDMVYLYCRNNGTDEVPFSEADYKLVRETALGFAKGLGIPVEDGFLTAQARELEKNEKENPLHI